MNYWKLLMWDGEEVKVKPENVEFIQAKLDQGEGFIKTPNRSIAVKNIKDFIESDEIYTDQKLLESSAQAFGEAIYNDDGSIIFRWVKKSVPKRQYYKYYAPTPGYRRLSEEENYVTVMWKQPVHLIDLQNMSELTPEDEQNLAKFTK